MNLHRPMNIAICVLLTLVAILGVIALIINAKRDLEKGDKRSFRYNTCYATALIFLIIFFVWWAIEFLSL